MKPLNSSPIASQSTLDTCPTGSIRIEPTGAIYLGKKKFCPEEGSIRRQILQIMARSTYGHLRKEDYLVELIDAYFKLKPKGLRLVTEPYLRRQNNVEKAISRLRQDLERTFKDDFPDGTAWMCFSKKLNGWLLFRLPGLGCDGEYHW
jgi:hypothetical protein